MKIVKYACFLIGICLGPSTVYANSEIKSDPKEVIAELLEKRSDIIGIDLLIAGEYADGPLFSRYGHAFIVFVDKHNENRYYDNIALSIVADIPAVDSLGRGDPAAGGFTNIANKVIDTSVLYFKGTVGAYDLMIEADYFYYFWNTYIRREKRPLERVIIPLNGEIKEKLMNQFLRISQSPDVLGSYKFFTNNCIVALTSFLRAGGIPVQYNPKIPNNAAAAYRKSHIAAAPIEKLNSEYAVVRDIAEYLKENKILTLNQFTDVVIQTLIDKFGVTAVYYLFESISGFPVHVKYAFYDKYRQGISKKNGLVNGFTSINKLYSLCTDIDCARAYLVAEKKAFSKIELAEAMIRRHQDIAKMRKIDNPYKLHKKLLVAAGKELVGSKKFARVAARGKLVTFDYRVWDDGDGGVDLEICVLENSPIANCNSPFAHKGNRRKHYAKMKMQVSETEKNIYNDQGEPCLDVAAGKFIGGCGLVLEGQAIYFYHY